jgi:hypothetical protein
MVRRAQHATGTTPRARRPSRLKPLLKTIFIGDWHPLLRDPLDVFRLSFVAGAVIYGLQGNWDAFVRLLIPGLLVFVVRMLDVPRPIDVAFCVAMFFQGWGNALHLFSQYWWYDNLVHITLPAALAPIFYVGFARLDVVPDPAGRVGGDSQVIGMALVAGCFGVTAASAYEIYEWAVDHWFGQHLFIGETDTITDLADGFLGAAIGGAILAAWALARYTSRRLPERLTRDLLSPPSTERGQPRAG